MNEEEQWRVIPEFPTYSVSDQGRIFNHRRESLMSISYTTRGHAKISLVDEMTGERITKSVARLVAEAFCRPPNLLCDGVVVLDGDFTNMRASNLVWRPEWFVWKYTRQLKDPIRLQYTNLPVYDIMQDVLYSNIVEAGMTEGLLFDHIWRSTYTGNKVFPNNSIFEIRREMV